MFHTNFFHDYNGCMQLFHQLNLTEHLAVNKKLNYNQSCKSVVSCKHFLLIKNTNIFHSIGQKSSCVKFFICLFSSDDGLLHEVKVKPLDLTAWTKGLEAKLH